MQTPSHFLLTAFGADWVKQHSSIDPHVTALLVGSVLPDIPFTLLTVLGEIYFLWFAALPGVGEAASAMQIMEYLHFDRFFTDPLWIVSHNTFHSLVINGLLMGIGWWFWRRRGSQWSHVLFWLATGMMIHTIIDVFTHSSDGPLIVFPLNWSYRFPSPVSYWEAENYGRLFILLEYLMDAAILTYFGVFWWRSGGARHGNTT